MSGLLGILLCVKHLWAGRCEPLVCLGVGTEKVKRKGVERKWKSGEKGGEEE